MEDRDAGTDQGPHHLVKDHQLGWREIARAQAISPKQNLPDTAGADLFAFHRQKRELIHRIKRPQIGSEFEAIDHLRRGSETDVLRAEIAMPLHYPAFDKPLQKQVSAAIDECLDSARDVLSTPD